MGKFNSALVRFNQKFVEKQKLRFYLLLVFFSFLISIILALIVAILSAPSDLSLVNKTQIVENLSVSYINNQIPVLTNSFFQIFGQNLYSGIIVLLLPGILLILAIFTIPRLAFYLEPTIDPKNSIKDFKLCFKYVVLLILVFYVFGSFSTQNLYVYFYLFPQNIAFSSFCHAVFEIPAMIISSVMSFYIIDEIFEIYQESEFQNVGMAIKKLIIEILIIIFVLIVVLAIAAHVETQITPRLTQQAFENYLTKS
jgi:uncharacterized membrane protein SpoIIM required for sporulation